MKPTNRASNTNRISNPVIPAGGQSKKEVSKLLNGVVSALVFLSIFLSTSYAQGDGSDVYWHIEPSVKECSIELNPSLTQEQFKKFTKQSALLTTFRALSSAEPLGSMNFSFGIDYSYTPVDQRDPAWINTFTHPDEDCPLGDAVVMPTLRGRLGISDNVDIGAYFTKAPEANYGFLAGEIKYAVLQESEKVPAVAIRPTFVTLLGVDDMDLNVYGVDFSASKKFGMFTPYLGIREILAVGTETTSKVDLDRESVWATQGIIGVTFSISRFNFAAEYNIAEVSTFAITTGFNF